MMAAPTVNIEFDFENYVVKMLPELENVDTESLSNPFGAFRGDPKHRTVVCKHWLLGLCQNGASCGWLHRLDRSKMPSCRHGTQCKIKACHMKHVDDQEVVECLFFKQGFCYNGPNCTRRHVKRLPDEIPKEAAFELAIASTATGAAGATQAAKKRKGPNENFKVSLCNHWLLSGSCHFNDGCIFAHGEEEIQDSYQSDLLQDGDVYDPTRFRMDAPLTLPFSNKARISYFLFLAPDLRSLAVSKRRGVWSVSAKLAQEINASLRAYDHVVAYMEVRGLKGLYGVIRITGAIPPSPLGLQAMTPEFPVLWLRTMRVSLKTVAQLKIGASGAFVGRTISDSKFESKVGSEIMYISYRKPEWDWSEESQLAVAESSLRKMRLDNGESPYGMPVHPDALFATDWVERTLNPQLEKKLSWSVSTTLTPAPAPAPAPDFYTLEFPGFIFNASGPIVEEIFGRSLFGLPAAMKDVNISPKAPLFMLDPMMQVMLGLFQATTSVTENIDPKAFLDWSNPAVRMNPATATSILPWQVRFSIVVESPPIPLMDPELIRIFSDLPTGIPMGGPISLKHTKALANLFAMRAGAMPMPGQAAGQFSAGGSKFGQFNKTMGQQRPGDMNMNTSVYKPPYPFVDKVPVDINGTTFDIKKRVLGFNGSNIKDIINEVGGPGRAIRIRIRGIGSGFIEGNMELQEPLHFNVCAESEDMLKAAVVKVKELVVRAKTDMHGSFT